MNRVTEGKMGEEREVDELETRVMRGLKSHGSFMEVIRKSKRLAICRNHGGPVVLLKEATVKGL